MGIGNEVDQAIAVLNQIGVFITQALTFLLGYFTPIELLAIFIIFLYAMNLTRKGRLTETLIKTALGVVIYTNAGLLANYFGIVGVIQLEAFKIILAGVVLTLIQWFWFDRARHE